MSDSIQDRVLKVIATTRRLPIESVTPNSTFEELGVDSLDRLNILFDLEGEFDIEIDDEQAKQVISLQQMIEGVTALVNAKAVKVDLSPIASSVPPAVPASMIPAASAAIPAPTPEPLTPLDPAILPAPLHDPAETED